MNFRQGMGRTLFFGVILCVCELAFVSSVHAGVTVVSLQMEQAKQVVVKIPQFDSGLDHKWISSYNREFRENVLKDYQEFETTALETRAMPTVPEYMKKALTFHSDYEVFRNDDRVVSLVQTTYQFTGGAHGMNWRKGTTLSAITGKKLTLGDLFMEGADYASRLSQVVRKEGAARNLPLWDFKGVGPNNSFYLMDEGLVLFFLPYEIAPYSEGVVKFTLPYRELADILRPEMRI